MGRLKEMEDILNTGVNPYAHTKIIPRGIPYFIDTLLRGKVRFGKRLGNGIAVLSPENTYEISQPVIAGQSELFLKYESPWITLDSIVSIGPFQELKFVRDIVDNKLIFDTPLLNNYDETNNVLHYGAPIEAFFNASQGDTQIQIKSKYMLTNGDVIGFLLTPSLVQSFKEVKSSTVIFGGLTNSNEYVYIVNLLQPLSRDIEEGETLYLRAFLGYFSQQIKTPLLLGSSNQIGPFLIDILSGKLNEGNEYAENLSVKMYDRAGGYLLGNDNEYITILKNFSVFDRSIHPHSFLFFNLANGSMRFSPNRILFKVDADGKFRIGQKCVPKIQANGLSYSFSVIANSRCKMNIWLDPYEGQSFDLNTGPNSITLNLPNDPDKPIENIEINIISDFDVTEVRMSTWDLGFKSVENLEYSFMSEAINVADYQATGLILKPYFYGSDLLGTRYDSGEDSDSGAIYF